MTPPSLKRIWENIRLETARTVYLDNNATTPLDPRVRRAMASVQRRCYGNASSTHLLGAKAREVVESAREQVARVVGAFPDEIIFTSGGTEANNTVIRAIAAINPKGHFITSAIEHDSVIRGFRSLESQGLAVTYLRPDRTGCVQPEQLEGAIRGDTVFASIMHLNNETGTVQPLARMAAVCRERKILFHSDMVQSFGKIRVDVREMPVDYLSFSAHKIYGPKGSGALFVRRGAPFAPLLEGGHQEEERRAGTEAVVNIAGFGRAAQIMEQEAGRHTARLAAMRTALWEGLQGIFPQARVNGDLAEGFPGTLNVLLPGVDNSELLSYLSFHKIALSAGSACTAGSDEPSHVLTALGLTPEEARSSVRISLGRFNRPSDTGRVLGVLRRFAQERESFFEYVFPAQLPPSELGNGGRLLVDIRTAAQRQRFMSIPGTTLCGRSVAALRGLPKDREILLICEYGYVSNILAPRLRRAGWPAVKGLMGGYEQWRQLYREYYYNHINGRPGGLT
ncbi:MAG: aminotransferase class V-fold PLP-dependent enzyme [Nitrospirales bacterium]|nr:aminotransferase class V-fold PLP-dependent enzyme [Nitrospirales bacterium]